MKHIVIISVFFLLKSLMSYSQSGESLLKSKLQNADTVLLVSHEETNGVKLVDENTGKEIPLPKLVVSGKPNNKIIIERQVVKDKQLDTLIQILARPFQDTTITTSKCFIPHHAIFIIKNGKISYLDICFHCRGFQASKDLEKVYSFDDRKWSELESFFIRLGFKYQLDTFTK